MRQAKFESRSTDDNVPFLSESFDRKMLLNMEAALDRASKELPLGQRDHDIRTFIANRIIECVVGGARSQDAMARAAMGAVKEIAEGSAL
jgi:hypothetical protein